MPHLIAPKHASLLPRKIGEVGGQEVPQDRLQGRRRSLNPNALRSILDHPTLSAPDLRALQTTAMANSARLHDVKSDLAQPTLHCRCPDRGVVCWSMLYRIAWV